MKFTPLWEYSYLTNITLSSELWVCTDVNHKNIRVLYLHCFLSIVILLLEVVGCVSLWPFNNELLDAEGAGGSDFVAIESTSWKWRHCRGQCKDSYGDLSCLKTNTETITQCVSLYTLNLYSSLPFSFCVGLWCIIIIIIIDFSCNTWRCSHNSRGSKTK